MTDEYSLGGTVHPHTFVVAILIICRAEEDVFLVTRLSAVHCRGQRIPLTLIVAFCIQGICAA